MVLCHTTGSLIPNATMRALDNKALKCRSDENGVYELEGPPDFTDTVEFMHESYHPLQCSEVLTVGSAVLLELRYRRGGVWWRNASSVGWRDGESVSSKSLWCQTGVTHRPLWLSGSDGRYEFTVSALLGACHCGCILHRLRRCHERWSFLTYAPQNTY